LRGRRLSRRSPAQQAQDIGIAPKAVEQFGVETIGNEHIGSNAHRNLVIALPVECQPIRLRTMKLPNIDLDRRGARGKYPVSHQVKPGE
jgi:hypothetical protein